MLISTVVMFRAPNRETINSTWKVAVSFKIIMTTSVTRPCFTYFTLPMPLSPRLLATWLHYHQLYEGVSILGQRTLSEGTILRRGSPSAAHHIGTCLKRSGTTSPDWLHTILCSYGSGSAMTMCGGVIRSPVAADSLVSYQCLVGHDCRIPNFLPPRF